MIAIVLGGFVFSLTDFGKVVYTSLRRLKVLLVCTYQFSTEKYCNIFK